jgi:hypothetical protein
MSAQRRELLTRWCSPARWPPCCERVGGDGHKLVARRGENAAHRRRRRCISLDIGSELVKFSAAMKLRHGCCALALVTLLLPAARASARTGTAGSSDETEETAAPEAPAEPANTSKPAARAEPEPADAPAEAYIGFAPPAAPLVFENPTVSMRFGLLAQPQFEMAGASDADKTSKNLFLRRFRFMVGGTLLKYFDYFFDVDYPDLFKADSTISSGGTRKHGPGLLVQDAFVTLKAGGRAFRLDAGYMLPAASHNWLQGAGTLYGWDYFVNTFRRDVFTDADPFMSSTGENPSGRDLGFQLRGLLSDHLEYRVGIYQGYRVATLPASNGMAGEVGALNAFRVAGRVQVNVLDAEPGFFYQGTYLGTKKILSFGAFYDFQSTYYFRGVDGILDLPAGPGVLTAQVNYVQWSGGASSTSAGFIPTLPKESALMAEAGYLIGPIMLSPIFRFENLVAATPMPTTPSERRVGGGLAFWSFGHNSNVKLFYTQVHRNPAPHDYSQVNLQWQVYFY